MRIGFIGLGVMGYRMAGHLANTGHDVQVYNRSPAKITAWLQEYPGHAALSPADAARSCELVFACVGADPDVRDITLGANGAFSSMEPDAIFIDHTTASATLARELDTATQARGLHFLDAPVSGGQAGAENGQLTIMVGGDAAVFARAEPVMQCYARQTRLLGPSGSGQLCKMVNQICIAGLVEGLAEGLHFARKAGLDPAAVIEVISKGAAQSWQMENRYRTMLAGEYNFGFAVDWMRKDLDMVFAEAAHNGAQLPITHIIDSYYAEVQRMGGGRWDTSSLLAHLEKLA